MNLMEKRPVLEQLAAAESWSEAGDVKRLFAASKAEIERLQRHNEAFRDVLFEVARLWPTVKDAPADVVVARCEAISACVATTLYELSNPAAEVGIEGHEPGKRDSAPGQRVAGPACTTDRESGASHSEGGASFKCCGAADPPCKSPEDSCQREANYPPVSARCKLFDAHKGHAQGRAPEHVCGLRGYNGMIDPPCPACEANKRHEGRRS